MDFILKNPWEIESIGICLNNETLFLREFIIYDDSNLIQSCNIKMGTTKDYIGEIQSSKINTGIMISCMKLNTIFEFLFILDNKIFIINQINLPKFQEYFNKHLDSLIFMTVECKENFFKTISSKNKISEQNDHFLKDQKEIYKLIKNEIIQCIIKKSQYRTIKMRYELLPDKYNSKNDKNYKLSDFFSIQSQGFNLCYNSKDQILNVLKSYDDEKRFKHEIDFYHQIENTFPFIRKIFGIIKQTRGLPVVILEYVEGERLDKLILSEKEIDFNTKIKIIEEILFSVYYVHSNGFFLRDLKPGNIIIDSQINAILIDFDSSKEMYSQVEEEVTGDIGNSVFTAPEQLKFKEYTYKVDSYSVGMIIHFIITQKKYNFNDFDLLQIFEKKENISKNIKFPKCPYECDFILSIYEKCFEISSYSRPSITFLIEFLVFLNNIQIIRANKAKLPIILKHLEKYESIFKISDKYMFEESIELSYLQYFIGCIYYSGSYTSTDINKAIFQLVKASNKKNSKAQLLLGVIYYEGKYISPDISKSIYYLTLSADQNDSSAQFLLGWIYYEGKYISRDIKKSIHYFTLSANQNDSRTQFYLGFLYYRSKYISHDINKSIYYLTLSANQKNSKAQFYLGEIYYKGQYISRDINKSIYYLTLSAYQNNSKAQFYLGEIYYKGQYISRDINKSIHYFTLSANQNHSDAQFYLGEIYYLNEYIPQDINKSIHYLTLSANQNNSNAQFYLGVLYYNGKHVSQDINKSIHYFTLSANQNNSNAQFYIGMLYYLSEYISRDINKSIKYFTLSANRSDPYAQCFLGLIYYLGECVSRDINKSIHYLTLSAKQNISDAQCLLGVIYYDNKYIEKDIKKSIHYFKESSSFYESVAKNYLGIIYKNGDGVEKNIYFAKIYFKEAIKQKDESYSMYNLARIYYFGIEHNRKIAKAITLLENIIITLCLW